MMPLTLIVIARGNETLVPVYIVCLCIQLLLCLLQCCDTHFGMCLKIETRGINAVRYKVVHHIGYLQCSP